MISVVQPARQYDSDKQTVPGSELPSTSDHIEGSKTQRVPELHSCGHRDERNRFEIEVS